MRKLNLSHTTICALVILMNIAVASFVILAAIDNLEKTILDSNKATESVVIVTKEVQEEIVPVYFDNEDYNYNGNMIYTFGDISDKFYFNILINEEQGLYVYCFRDMRIEYESLAELQESVMCHIDQAWPNATFVTVSR